MKTIFTMAICLTLCFNLTAQEHAKMMRAHELWVAPWELRGKNQVVAVFEYGYALASHKEFYKNRVTVPNKPVDILPNWHTVGTTGVICARGVDPKVKGVVYESKVQSYYIADGDSQAELLKKYFPIERWAVTNHSYSKRSGWHLRQDGIWQWTGFLPTAQHPDPFGAYLEESRLFDSVVHANNYVIPVVTAGNQRGQVPSPNQYVYYFIPGSEQTTVYYTGGPNDPPKNGGAKGYDCLPPTAVAKNVITVGCVDAAK